MDSNLTAERILTIRQPERLFPKGIQESKQAYRSLLMVWHPDRSDHVEAAQVASHITSLYREAIRKLEEGTWETIGLLELRDTEGKLNRIRYRAKKSFELGETYIGDGAVAYVVRDDFADLFENARRVLSGLRYPNDKMKEEFSRYVPNVRKIFHTTDKCVMVIRKTPDLLPLGDVVGYFGGKMDPKHVAWIQNTIHNLSCYLSWAQLTHNAIDLDNYFISPPYHGGALLGGWWYATPTGSRLTALPQSTIRVAPPSLVREKIADHRLDLQSIRAMGREMLGDRSGMRLVGEKEIPQPIVDFLRLPSGGNAVEDYTTWSEKVLPASFGKRRFHKLDVDGNALYGKETQHG